ncbi:hypothetical protein JK628_18470 [Shewanella sp. KX20019]|uniref:hypothetical protein n=1 Tax=Shewanella sp. KX20019 TaxID=2803864 RepID=UPI0019273DB5|nr:hypothetical protein [Shewanella sp. KX20019]QQX79489.1 hypothetical protein JK628_18470 [Shewanella sp. KX20019]
MKIAIYLLLTLLFVNVSTFANADEQRKNYALNGAIYQWYGQLDRGILPTDLVSKSSIDQPSLFDSSYYQNGQIVAGAHHLLQITPITKDSQHTQVEVTFEFYHYDEEQTRVTGRYVIQSLTLENDNLSLVSSQNITNELDDFESKYIPSSDNNLIRSLVYRWTNSLDKPGSVNIKQLITASAPFKAAETSVASAKQYPLYLASLNFSDSRRVIKNLQISKQVIAQGRYSVSYEYQWTAINAEGELELAQVGVNLSVDVANGIAVISDFWEEYLPPVTDLGAEIRC